MSDHAVVIGCDAYPKLPDADLRGAVADALAVRTWLITRGAVPVENVTLHAAPSTRGARLEEGLTARPCTRDALTETLEGLLSRTDVGEHDRLYFYFAGHGLRTDPLNPSLSRDALALEDLSRDPGSGTVGVDDLVARLEFSRFGEVVVVADACRNIAYDRAFTILPLGFDPEAPAGRVHWPHTYKALATIPGGTAEGEVSANGVVHGFFTSALLSGLEGGGTAKRFDETAAPPYRVTWRSLQEYVEMRVADQQPRMRGDGDLLLASFPDGWFPMNTLTVHVEPAEAGADSSLTVVVSHSDRTGLTEGKQTLAGPAPVTVRVPPRRQQVEVRRGDSMQRIWSDVYEDTDVVVPIGANDSMTPMTGAAVVRSKMRHAGQVELRTDADPAAVIELRDSSDRVVRHGIALLSGAMSVGFYSALVSSMNGQRWRVPLEVGRGKLTSLDLLGDPLKVPQPSDRPGRRQPSVLSLTGELLDDQLVVRLPVEASLLVVRAPEGWVVDTDYGPAEVDAPEGRVRVWELGRGDRWVRLTTAGHSLTVPVMEGLATAVVLDDAEAQVGIYDRGLGRSDPVYARVDRVQDLLRLGRRGSALMLVEALVDDLSEAGEPPKVAESLLIALLEAAVDDHSPSQRFLASGVSVPLRPYLLPDCVWAVFLDLPGDARRLL